MKPYIIVNPIAGSVGDRPIAPQANLSDGLLDVVLVPKRPAAEMALLAAEMLLGKHISSDAVVFRRAKKSQSNRGRESGSTRTANWSEISRLPSKLFLTRYILWLTSDADENHRHE